jgi:hypothetical protein
MAAFLSGQTGHAGFRKFASKARSRTAKAGPNDQHVITANSNRNAQASSALTRTLTGYGAFAEKGCERINHKLAVMQSTPVTVLFFFADIPASNDLRKPDVPHRLGRVEGNAGLLTVRA